jgi:hypothetical protein
MARVGPQRHEKNKLNLKITMATTTATTSAAAAAATTTTTTTTTTTDALHMSVVT